MRVLITGASGFIGRHLVKALEQMDRAAIAKATSPQAR